MDKKEDFEERLRRYTRVVVEQIDILAEISQDFSMLAAVGLDKLEEVNWTQATKEVAALYQQSNPQIEWCTSIPDIPVFIEGSKAHLTRAMNNLIANAIDAVANESYPSITLGLEVSPEGKAFLTVEDNGIGIPEDKQKEIFQPHFTSKEKGTGLPVHYRLHRPPIERSNNASFVAGSRFGLWFGVFREIKKGHHAEALSKFV